MKTYDTTLLSNIDPKSLEWAVAWVRMITNDKETNGVYPPYSLEDEEWEAYLELTSELDDNDVKYYLPFEAVAVKVLSDPTYAEQITEEGYSQSFRSASALAEHLRSTESRRLARYYPTEVISGASGYSMHPYF